MASLIDAIAATKKGITPAALDVVSTATNSQIAASVVPSKIIQSNVGLNTGAIIAASQVHLGLIGPISNVKHWGGL